MFEEKITWHEVTKRPLTAGEQADYFIEGYSQYEIPDYVFECEMPEDGQEILIATVYEVSQDMCMSDCDGCALETHGDWDDVIAWAPMPKYKGGNANGKT